METYYPVVGNQFYGSKDHKIDSKNRIAIPASMRSDLGQEFVISKGFDSCISLYPLHEWSAYLTKIKNSNILTTRKNYIARQFSANSERTSLDSQGRVVLPEKLQKLAGIFGDGQARIIGCIDHIEIWKLPEEDEAVDLGALMDEVDQSYTDVFKV